MKETLALSITLFVNISLFSQCFQSPLLNELSVSIDFEDNNLSISSLDCDICELGYKGNRNCKCRQYCNRMELDACMDKCQFLQNSQVKEYCLDWCQTRYVDYFSCVDKCGELPLSERQAVDFKVHIYIWYNNGPTETFSGQPKIIVRNPLILGNPPNVVKVNLNHEFPKEPISYCFLTQTFLNYNDGTCCIYYDFECFNLA